jgi:hypothetical protein
VVAGRTSPEFDLLCLALSPSRDVGRLRTAFERPIDPARLLALVEGHRVRPALSSFLEGLPSEGVPQVLRSSLRAFEREHLLHTLKIAHQLRQVSQLLDEAGIQFANFKGATLALSVYGNLAAREFNDIDIIVPEGQVVRAEAVLGAAAYFNRQGDQAFRHAFLRHQRQYALSCDGAAADIDLHWAFTADRLPFPLDASEIWPVLASVDLGGQRLPVLNDEDLALLLAGHGTKEEWRSLAWVADFAMLANRRTALDWQHILERAQRQGSGISVLLAWAMAHRLFEMPVPQALAGPLMQSTRANRTADHLIDRLRTTLPDQVARLALEDGVLCDRSIDRLRAGLAIALAPTPRDYEAFPLPASLWPLYKVTRPVRLTMRALSRALQT